jgi:hypothetical protein
MRTSFQIPSDVKVSPTPSPPAPSHPAPTDQASPSNNPFHTGSDEEAQWQTSLQNFEQQMISYQHSAGDGGEAEQESAERVAQAMEHIAESHTDPKVKAQWRKTAKKFRKSQPKEREGFVVALLKGFLIFLTLPLYIVGTVFHATGEICEGLAFFFKTTGQVTKRLTYKGGPFLKR